MKSIALAAELRTEAELAAELDLELCLRSLEGLIETPSSQKLVEGGDWPFSDSRPNVDGESKTFPPNPV